MAKKKKNRAKNVKETAAVLPGANKTDTPSDIIGSYTGTPANGGHPEQDADDL